MLKLITGSYLALPAELRQAIHKLTVDRYTKEIYRYDQYLQSLGMALGTPEYEGTYQRFYHQLDDDLSHTPQDMNVSGIFAETPSGLEPICILRAEPGSSGARIAQTIGDPASTLFTHQVLQGFQHPSLPGWDPEQIREAQVYEPTRIVRIDKIAMSRLIQSGFLAKPEVDYLLSNGFTGIFPAMHRRNQSCTPGMAGYVAMMFPFLVSMLLHSYHLNWIPLASRTGIGPTPVALSPQEMISVYFRKELPEYQTLFSNGRRKWHYDDPDILRRHIYVPVILPNDEKLEASIRQLEAQQEEYGFIERIEL